jgi:hypothetical protein
MSHLLVFLLVILFSEVIYRIWLRTSKVEVTQKELKRSITLEEFTNLVHFQQKKLVILDNKVLDLVDYDHFHPGGKFTF